MLNLDWADNAPDCLKRIAVREHLQSLKYFLTTATGEIKLTVEDIKGKK